MTFRIPRKKIYPYSDTPMKNYHFLAHIYRGTPQPPTPLSCPLSALASVAERLPPSPYNPKVPGSNPGADLFFFFCCCPHCCPHCCLHCCLHCLLTCICLALTVVPLSSHCCPLLSHCCLTVVHLVVFHRRVAIGIFFFAES